jgi:hypothetical protein
MLLFGPSFLVHENTATLARQGRATARASGTGQAVRIGAQMCQRKLLEATEALVNA